MKKLSKTTNMDLVISGIKELTEIELKQKYGGKKADEGIIGYRTNKGTVITLCNIVGLMENRYNDLKPVYSTKGPFTCS